MPDDELVPVMVQRKYLAQVYGFIAQLEGQTTQLDISPFVGGDVIGSVGVRAAEHKGWTEEELGDIVSSKRGTVQRIVKVMDVLSGNADKKVPMSELAAAAGLTRGELQGALSGFTRWCNSTYGYSPGGQWPFWVEIGPPTASDLTAESYYRTDGVTASRWDTVRGRTATEG
jgi:hypothetical protein